MNSYINLNLAVVLTLVGSFIGGCSDVVDVGKTSQSSIYDPHVPDGPGPWFEGWYTRITDRQGNRSIGIIAAAHIPRDQIYTPGMTMPGYLAVLVSEGNETRSYEVFPEQVTFLKDGQPVANNPDLVSPANFKWIAVGFGSVTEDSLDIRIPGKVEVNASFTERLPWNKTFPEASPEGISAVLPVTLHWHVHSLGSMADYKLTLHQKDQIEVYNGHGYAHQEKNWGQAFPEAWCWGQGITDDNRSQFVFAGGKVDSSSSQAGSWIVGYRSEKVRWSFRPTLPGTVFDTYIDACSGEFVLTIKDLTRTLVIDGQAPLDSFCDVAIPTVDGFMANGGVESFSATMTVSAYRHNPIPGLNSTDKLVDQRVFQNAALEYGAGYVCLE